MLESILILSPRSSGGAELERAFQEQLGAACPVVTVSTRDELLALVDDTVCEQVVVLPERLPGRQRSGLGLIPAIRARDADALIVIVAEQGNVDAAARAIDAGANDFLVLGPQLPQRIATLLGKLRSLIAAIDHKRQADAYNAQLCETLQASCRILGRSPAIRKLLTHIQRVAQVPRPVLVLGERGTGKELVARAIHFAAGPPSRPLITVNCAAFSDALLESELFGHERGAFTGADTSRRGRFELADGGTLFLDEIGHMSLAFQQKILRVVEYGSFQRVGGTTELRSTARIVAATNCDLRQRIARGEFLADLYDRLAFEVLEIPPLRERGTDIELLSRHFLDEFARDTPDLPRKVLGQAALATLKRYTFPGNVRELKTIIERAAYRDRGTEIGPTDLGLPQAPGVPEIPGSFDERVDAYCRRLIEEALQQSGNNQAAAARQLGLSYHQFRYYVRKFRLPTGPARGR